MKVQLHSTRFSNCFYQKLGTGFPILLVHGFAETSQIWNKQIEKLQQNHTLLIPDLPGSGSSELPTEPMNLELLADFLVAILDQEKIEKTILFGHSMGGYTALAFAQKYEEKLMAFALVHSSAFEDDETKKENRRKSINLIENNGKEVFLNAMIPNLYSEASKQTKQIEIKEHLTIALGIASDTLVAYYSAMLHRPSRISVLEKTTLPVLFIIGTEDTAVPLAQSLKQCAIPSISMIEILENVGHLGMFENPEKISSIANNFCIEVLKTKKA